MGLGRLPTDPLSPCMAPVSKDHRFQTPLLEDSAQIEHRSFVAWVRLVAKIVLLSCVSCVILALFVALALDGAPCTLAGLVALGVAMCSCFGCIA